MGRREVLRGAAEQTHGLADEGEAEDVWRRMMVEVRERSSVRKSLLCRWTSVIRAWISRSSRWYSRRVVAASSFSSPSMPDTLAASRALLTMVLLFCCQRGECVCPVHGPVPLPPFLTLLCPPNAAFQLLAVK